MKKPLTAGERALRIELARARAALERERLARNMRDLGHDLTPGRLAAGLFPRLAVGANPIGWLSHAGVLARRYPMLLSVASAALSNVGRRRRWWRVGAALLRSEEHTSELQSPMRIS